MIALLEEALPFDLNGRVRSALAQAYLRQGQAVKGHARTAACSPERPASIRGPPRAPPRRWRERSCIDEAIGFLRAELPDGGDWRSRYLLAVLLEEDGRETEALPIFLDLLRATGDIPGVAARGYRDTSSAECRALSQLVSAQQAAYTHRNPPLSHDPEFRAASHSGERPALRADPSGDVAESGIRWGSADPPTNRGGWRRASGFHHRRPDLHPPGSRSRPGEIVGSPPEPARG